MKLQQFESMDARIFYDQYQLFIHQLYHITSKDNLQMAWQQLSPNMQQKALKDYTVCKQSVFADLLINKMQGKTEDAQVLQFLFDNGFTLNKYDIKKLKSHHWLEYRSYDAGMVYEVNVWMHIKKAWHYTCKALGMQRRPALYVVQFFSLDMLKVLFAHVEKLPKKLKSKVLRDMPDSELKKYKNKQFEFV